MDPYDPQRPSPPESFAGRTKLVERTQGALEAARLQRASTAIMVHGHRGSGKTSALRKIQALALEATPDAVTIEIPLRQASSDAALLRTIVEEITSDIRRKQARDATRREWWSAKLERLKAINIQVLGSGVSVERDERPQVNPNALTAWRETLDVLDPGAVLNICIDDAEHLNEAGVGTLKTIAEARSPVPMLLAVSAGPELVERLGSPEFSPVARAFSGATFDMEDFTLPETRAALEAPLHPEHATGRWADEAVRLIHELSHGNPYLVKCLASAAYRDGAVLTEDDVRHAVPKALDIASPWLAREISRAADGDIKAFAKIARSGKMAMKSKDIVELGINGAYIGRLVLLGVLRKVAPGHYELRKAPVIAYYHELKRKLG